MRALTAGRRILPLGQAVDFVVEQHELAIKIAAQQMHRVIAADRQRISVTGDDPHVQLWIGQLDTGRHRWCTAMDGVETIGLHIIGKARGAANAADEDGIGRISTKVGHRALYGLENGVIAATRAPTHFLIGFPVFQRRRDFGHLVHDRFSSITAAISAMVNGWPETLFTGFASTRY